MCKRNDYITWYRVHFISMKLICSNKIQMILYLFSHLIILFIIQWKFVYKNHNYIYKNTERGYLIKNFTIHNYMSQQCFCRAQLFATRRNLAALYRSRAARVYHVVILSWIHSSELFALRITNRTNSGAFVNKFSGGTNWKWNGEIQTCRITKCRNLLTGWNGRHARYTDGDSAYRDTSRNYGRRPNRR